MKQLESHNSLQQGAEQTPERSVDLKKLNELQARVDSWKDLLSYAEKNYQGRLEMIDRMHISDADKAAQKAEQTKQFEQTKAEYLKEIAALDQQVSGAKPKMEAAAVTTEVQLETTRERAEVASDAFLLEKSVASVLRAYPQLKGKLGTAETKLLELEQTMDAVQRSLQEGKQMTQETKLLVEYKAILQNMLAVLENITGAGATEAAINGAVTKEVETGIARLEKAFASALSAKGGVKVSGKDAASRIAAVYAQGGGQQRAGLKNEISNMRVALITEAMGRQHRAKEDAIATKVDAMEHLDLDMSLATDTRLHAILKTLAEKAGTSDVNVTGFMGNYDFARFNANSDVVKALLQNMGADVAKVEIQYMPWFAPVLVAYNIGRTVMDFAEYGSGSPRAWAGIAAAAWTLIIGDLQAGRVETLKSMDKHDLHLYAQYSEKIQRLEKTTDVQQKAKLEKDIANLGLLISKRGLDVQRGVVAIEKPWFATESTLGAIDAKLADLVQQDAEGILPLHDRYLALSQDLYGKNLQDPALKDKVEELQSLEQQLRDKGVNMLDYMDYVRGLSSIKVTMPEGQEEYFNYLKGSLSATEMEHLLSTGEYRTYLQTLAKNKDKMGEQAATFVKSAVYAMQKAGMTPNIDLSALESGTSAERFAAAQKAFDALKQTFDAQIAQAPTLRQLTDKLENAMEKDDPALWNAYSTIKGRLGSISAAEARALLEPHVKRMYDAKNMYVTGAGMAARIFTLGAITMNPERELLEGSMARFARPGSSAEDLLQITAEMFGAFNYNLGLGKESAEELVKLRHQETARNDFGALETAMKDYDMFYNQLSKETELYASLSDAIETSGAQPTEKAKMRSLLTSYQKMLQTAYSSLEQFSAEQMSSLLTISQPGVTQAFQNYSVAVRRFLNTYSLAKIHDAMHQAMNEDPAVQAQKVAALDAQYGNPMRSEFAKLKGLSDALTQAHQQAEAAKTPRAREVYSKNATYDALSQREVGYTANELAERADIKQLVDLQRAYRLQVRDLNNTMAALHGVSNLDATLNNGAANAAKIDRLMVIGEDAFDDMHSKKVLNLVPTDPAEVATEKARYQRMKDRAEVYAKLLQLPEIQNIAKVSGNRDATLVQTLVRLGFMKQPQRSLRQRNAFSDLGVITMQDLQGPKAAEAMKRIDPSSKLSKQEVVGLLNTLVLLSGTRGHARAPREQHATFADTLQWTFENVLPKYRQNFKKLSNTNVEGYTEASFVHTFVEDQDIFQILRTLKPVSAQEVPAGTKFINLGITGGSSSTLVLRNNDTRFFSSEVVKNIGGAELAYKVFLKEGCMNVQIPEVNILRFMRQLQMKLNLPKVLPDVPELQMPEVQKGVFLKKFEEVFTIVNRNPLALTGEMWTFITTLIPPTTVPDKPGTPITPRQPEVPTTAKPSQPITPRQPAPKPNPNPTPTAPAKAAQKMTQRSE